MSVKIITSKKNNVFEPTKKAGLLCLAVEEIQADQSLTLNGKHDTNQSRRIAFIFRTQEKFDAIFAAMGVKPVAGAVIEGKVAIKEQLEPLSSINPMNGVKYPNAAMKAAGIPCRVNGAPVYRDSYFTTDMSTEDILIAHDNKAAIQNFVNGMNKPNTDAVKNASPVTA